MNKLETNALRIAELTGYKATADNKYFISKDKHYQSAIDYNELINSFSFYSGLMPIVFECNKSSGVYYGKIKIYPEGRNYAPIFPCSDSMEVCDIVAEYRYNPESESEFIEAIQLAVIKYLELKNG